MEVLDNNLPNGIVSKPDDSSFARNPSMLRTIVRDGDQQLGIYAKVVCSGEVAVGDPVALG